MAPTGEVQVIAAQAAQTVTPSPTQTAAAASLTAVSDCHLHDSTM
jgi:zinc transporter 1/2/3